MKGSKKTMSYIASKTSTGKKMVFKHPHSKIKTYTEEAISSMCKKTIYLIEKDGVITEVPNLAFWCRERKFSYVSAHQSFTKKGKYKDYVLRGTLNKTK